MRQKVERKGKDVSEKIAKSYKVEIFDASQKDKGDFQITPTGFKELDEHWGGGMVAGFNQIWGAKETGKSTIALEIAANCIRDYDMRLLYVDFEHKMTPSYMEDKGIKNLDKHMIMRPEKNADALMAVAEMIHDGAFDIVIIDSIGCISTRNDADIEKMASHSIGDRATIVGNFVNRINHHCVANNIPVICINQARKNIVTNVHLAKYAPEDRYPGGNVYEHTLINSVLVTAKKFLKNEEGNNAGRIVKFTIDKNKLGCPYASFEYELWLGKGFTTPEISLIDMAIQNGIIEKKGGWLSFDGKTYRRAELEEMLDGEIGEILEQKLSE